MVLLKGAMLPMAVWEGMMMSGLKLSALFAHDLHVCLSNVGLIPRLLHHGMT